jgi:hypothetical protein
MKGEIMTAYKGDGDPNEIRPPTQYMKVTCIFDDCPGREIGVFDVQIRRNFVCGADRDKLLHALIKHSSQFVRCGIFGLNSSGAELSWDHTLFDTDTGEGLILTRVTSSHPDIEVNLI